METYNHLHVSDRDGNQIIGYSVKFERILRITGYLVGTVDRFNDAKRADVRDRVKHMDMKQARDQKY